MADFTGRLYRIGFPPDADGDVVLAGAIEDGDKAQVSLAQHDTMRDPTLEPAGEAVLRHQGEAVVGEGTIYDTPRGRELRKRLRERGGSQQWSVGYRVLESRRPTPAELALYPDTKRVIARWAVDEISPVVLGACGPTCRTLAAKGVKCACGCSGLEEAALRELLRFEKTKAHMLALRVQDIGRELAERARPPHWSTIAEQHEVEAWEVHEQRRAAAAKGIALALAALGSRAVPAVRWFRHDTPGVDALGWSSKGRDIWIRDGLELSDTASVAAHEVVHHLGHRDEAMPERVGAIVRAAYTMGAKVLSGHWRAWTNNPGAQEMGTLCVEPETLTAWRRIGPLDWERL